MEKPEKSSNRKIDDSRQPADSIRLIRHRKSLAGQPVRFDVGETMVFKHPKSDNWYYKFHWRGELVRRSTRQTNKRLAEQLEAAHKTALAKGEVGIKEREPA